MPSATPIRKSVSVGSDPPSTLVLPSQVCGYIYAIGRPNSLYQSLPLELILASNPTEFQQLYALWSNQAAWVIVEAGYYICADGPPSAPEVPEPSCPDGSVPFCFQDTEFPVPCECLSISVGTPLPGWNPIYNPVPTGPCPQCQCDSHGKATNPPCCGKCSDPPYPMALDSNGFYFEPKWVALPTHPVLSDRAVREVCGVCGEENGGEEWAF